MARVDRGRLATLAILLLLLVSVCQSIAIPSEASLIDADVTPRSVAAADAPLLRVIEVDPPVRFEQVPGSAPCQETLVTYSFANSYGKPYVGK